MVDADFLDTEDWEEAPGFWYSDFCYYSFPGGRTYHEQCPDLDCDCECH